MIRHIFLDKCNTIIEDSEYNTGCNPVAELNVGNNVSRILTHFNIDEIKKEEYGENTKYFLKMTNCGGINLPAINEELFNNCIFKKRASSFDIIAFKIPSEWDEGRGFDYCGDVVKGTNQVLTTEGSNWYYAKSGVEWDEYGVYRNRTLLEDYNNNFNINKNSVIIGVQHFDNGAENLKIDITNYVNDVLNGKTENNGIGLAFAPLYENEMSENRFIAFFTNHTNTFFLPYIEMVIDETIIDNRANFHIGSKNRLYFFVSDNGAYIDLDEMPICTINDKIYEVKKNSTGVYYVEVLFNKDDVEPNTILTDIWSNIKINGNEIDDVEMEFVVLPLEGKITLGKHNTIDSNIYPQLYNINDSEKIKIGDIREVMVDFIEEYSYGKKVIPTSSEYRVYVKEGDREIDVFQYQPFERRYDQHMFILNTNDLIPNTYHIDIKVIKGRDVKHYNDILEFKVVSNVTNQIK